MVKREDAPSLAELFGGTGFFYRQFDALAVASYVRRGGLSEERGPQRSASLFSSGCKCVFVQYYSLVNVYSCFAF